MCLVFTSKDDTLEIPVVLIASPGTASVGRLRTSSVVVITELPVLRFNKGVGFENIHD